jgi:predicted  nucleic acid-binding Zn-ribbon protein
MQLSDSLATARSEMEVKRKEVAELERDVIIMEDSTRSIERGITSSRSKLASLSDDHSQLHSAVTEQEQECKVMEEELQKIEERCNYLQSRINALPQAKMQQTNRMKECVGTMEIELQKIRGSADQGKVRASGLHRYIEMMIGINAELCDTILAREEAKARVMRIAGKMTSNTSGDVGSTVLPYAAILNASTRALENEAQKAVKDARTALKMHSNIYKTTAIRNSRGSEVALRKKTKDSSNVKQQQQQRKKKMSPGKDLFVTGTAQLFLSGDEIYSADTPPHSTLTLKW